VVVHRCFHIFLIRPECDHLFGQLSDLNNGLAAFDRLSLLDRESDNLTVIAVGTAVLQRIAFCTLSMSRRRRSGG
jgi:hypothetical protein